MIDKQPAQRHVSVLIFSPEKFKENLDNMLSVRLTGIMASCIPAAAAQPAVFSREPSNTVRKKIHDGSYKRNSGKGGQQQ